MKNLEGLAESEYVVGFYGSFGEYLNSFGCYVANETHEFREEEYDVHIE